MTPPVAEAGLDATVRVGDSPTVQVLAQRTVCPAAYPRRDGVPTKQPLF